VCQLLILVFLKKNGKILIFPPNQGENASGWNFLHLFFVRETFSNPAPNYTRRAEQGTCRVLKSTKYSGPKRQTAIISPGIDIFSGWGESAIEAQRLYFGHSATEQTSPTKFLFRLS